MNVVTRFAPSPTGFLHIGGARTALFNYLFTRRYKGKFLLRIEDTDKVRSTDKAIKAIISGLEWLNLNHNGKIVFQSNNSLRHKNIADELLKSGNAYRCYLSIEEQNQIRNDCMKRGLPFRSPWRNKKYNNENENSYVIRIKMPDEGFTEIKDLVQGKVKFANNKLDDFVLLRSNSLPTYMLAVVVDDYDMGITHIIRGDDHLNNAFRQYWIYKFLDWKVPDFAHIPLIHGEDGSKLSKRHGALGVEEYKEMGFLSDSINSYLMNLGWRASEKEPITLSEASKIFEIKSVGKSSSKFNISKLKNINSYFLRTENPKNIINLIISNNELGIEKYKNRIIKALPYLIERASTINDLVDASTWLKNDNYEVIFKENLKFNSNDLSLLVSFKEYLRGLNIDSKIEIEDYFNKWLAKENLKIKDIGKNLRLCLTGSGSSIDLIKILDILGIEEIICRLSYNLDRS